MPAFLLGVNYWPRRSAMYMWQRFDAAEIREDLARIADWGCDLVRFFLLWEDFQPEPGRCDRVMRDRLITFADAAQTAGIACIPTLLTGHMSGVNWLPEWTLDRTTSSGRFRSVNSLGVRPHGIGDFYRGTLLDAQAYFAAECGSWLRGHPAVHCWDLGNEFSNLRAPGDSAAAAEWSKHLTGALVESSGIGVTGGLHGEDITEDRRIRVSSIAAPWRHACMHGYPAYSSFARSPADVGVVMFLHDVTRAFARKDVLFAELGTPGPESTNGIVGLDEDAAADYCYAAIDALHRRGALGALWWCYADYAPALAALPPFDRAAHELSFGVIRADGTEKPVARALRAFAAEKREVADPPPVISIDEEPYYAGLPRTLASAYAAYVSARKIDG